MKPRHDEDEIYASEVAGLDHGDTRSKHDWYAFTVAFKGVFLEGLEVAFIVVTIGSAQDNLGVAAVGAAVAFVVVLLAGIVVHGPLSRVPENALKFGVGVMLTAFGIFWSGEGAGVAWPGRDAALLALIVFVLACRAGSSSSFVARPQRRPASKRRDHEVRQAVRTILVRLRRR